MNEMNVYQEFVHLHEPQLHSSGVPEYFWPTLFHKLYSETFDAGNSFQLMLIDYNEINIDTNPVFALYVSKEEGIQVNNPQEIYLIDHAWTFKANQVRSQLEELPSLADRMCAITGVDLEDPERIIKVEKAIWRYCQSYSIQAEGVPIEQRMPIWYVMDEVGSAVNHSDTPNFRIVPFIFLPSQTTYSLLFPIKNCDEGDPANRDFVENLPHDSKIRNALLLPWKNFDFRSESFEQKEPPQEYFVSGHVPEILPEGTLVDCKVKLDQPLKVYSEYDVLTATLTSEYFEFVEKQEDADILWLGKHFQNFKELHLESSNRFINQFPYEYVLTIKDLLAIISKRKIEKHHDPETLETFPDWLPSTFNLKTELVEFVSYFQNREYQNLDNHWIIKPWNLARGLDTEITTNLWKILRLQTTGPKIAQKYIENPVLFYRTDLGCHVKFDIRYIILLKSVEPLVAYVHTKFYLRFANKRFSLDSLEDYEKHFTVMNYAEEIDLKHIRCENFLNLWQEQYPEFKWNDIEDNICKMFHQVLLCATISDPPCGIANFKQSRALYAADLMLSWDKDRRKMQPKLLEINWMPDCKRASEYYPEFFNDIFKLLFLDEIETEQFKLVTNC